MENHHVLINNIKNHLTKEGISPSYQRIKIFEYLSNNKNHPTIDEIYNQLKNDIPTLSKTTVYNTLNLFLKKGLVGGLTIEDNEMRYDATTVRHAHLKCSKCGKIYDISIDCPFLNRETLNGHRIDDCHLYFKGVCKHCLKKITN